MNIIDVKREIAFSKLLGIKLPNDIKELLDFFKELTYIYEKREDGLETWYDPNGEIRIRFLEKRWDYIQFSYEKWEILRTKYFLTGIQTKELISGMLGIVTKGRMFPTVVIVDYGLDSWE